MKRMVISGLFLLLFSPSSFCQTSLEGKVHLKKFLAPSIQNNEAGEDLMRQISVYLPPNYNESQDRYPAIYFLHGFAVDNSQLFEWLVLKQLLDKAIETKQIRPIILVAPNSYTRFGGSFYTNSELSGKWGDFIAKDVVEYVDNNFRTIPHRDNRGVAGHSIGGNGALIITMQYPNIFSSVYAMSPAVLDWAEDFSKDNFGFTRINESLMQNDIRTVLNNFEGTGDLSLIYAAVLISLGRVYTPSGRVSFFMTDFPVTYEDGQPHVHEGIKRKWEANFPMNMIDTHLEAIKSLKGIKIDWDRNEDFPHISVTALKLSKKLKAKGIKHFAEEYIGNHVNKLNGIDGRIYLIY